MQQEIDQLQTSVADMKKNIAFDDELFDDLDEFGKKVSCSRYEWMENFPKRNLWKLKAWRALRSN